MKIYTKKGDLGQTRLGNGYLVSKSDLVVDCYGSIDELIDYFSLILDSLEQTFDTRFLNHYLHDELISYKNQVTMIQRCLMDWASLVAQAKTNTRSEDISNKVQELETYIDRMEQQLKPLQNFILPQGYLTIAYTNLARIVCRRVERQLVKFYPTTGESNLIPLQYFNRLSDYLFVLTRTWIRLFNKEEIKWEFGQ